MSDNIRAFDWGIEFPHIMNRGGFDVIIGNPPYIFMEKYKTDKVDKSYFDLAYYHQGIQSNMFGFFIELGYRLLDGVGTLGFITANNWLTLDGSHPLRKFVIKNEGGIRLYNIVGSVFDDVSVDVVIFILKKGDSSFLEVGEIGNGEVKFKRRVSLEMVTPPSYIIRIRSFESIQGLKLLKKIDTRSSSLSDYAKVSTGMKVYQTGKGKPPQTDEKLERSFHSHRRIDESYGKYLSGSDVQRYFLGWSGEWLSYGEWIAEMRKSVPFKGARILVRQIPSLPPYSVNAVYTSELLYNDTNSMVIFDSKELSIKYILGIINSKLITYWFNMKYDKLQRKVFPQFRVRELKEFAIYPIDFNNFSEKVKHDKVVDLVIEMLDLHEQLSGAEGAAKHELKERINAIDHEIDQLVYDLYELTPEEIEIVESSVDEH